LFPGIKNKNHIGGKMTKDKKNGKKRMKLKKCEIRKKYRLIIAIH